MYIPLRGSQRFAAWRDHRFLLFMILILGLLLLLVAQIPLFTSSTAVTNLQARLTELPLSFVPNAGQTDTAVRFQAHDFGSTVYFTPTEVILSLHNADPNSVASVSMRFEGANPQPAISAADKLPGVVNYLIGSDASQWHINVPTYGAITYSQLYPGIDLQYDGSTGALKGTYTVAPGVNPAQIRWSHSGAASVNVDSASGNLLITLPAQDSARATTVVEEAPVAWQTINGARVPVDVRYAVAADGSVGFALGNYNPAHALIIDPTIIYSTYLGGSQFEDAEGIAVAADGSAYVTGTTDSSDFPISAPFQGTKRGDEDIYVTKLNPAGDALVYSTFIGGSGDDEGYDITIDANGSAYVVGSTDSGNFPTQNPWQNARNGFTDAYVLKLNPAGNGLIYSTYLGGGGFEEGEGIAIDAANNAYVTGATASNDFPAQAGVQASYGGGGFDGFVAKLNAAGTLVYGTYLGGTAFDTGGDIAVGSDGTAYIVGDTASTDFPLMNAAQTARGGSSDAFVTRLSADGSELLFSTFLGGSFEETGYGIALDSDGNAYVTGETESSNFPTTTGAFQTSSGGYVDAFVTKVSADGSWVYSTYLGGGDADRAYGIAVDSADSAYVTGSTMSGNFPIENALQPAMNGGSDAFITKFNSAGDGLLYSTYLGGLLWENGDAIAVDNAGNAFVAGVTGSANFPLEGPVQDGLRGPMDVFVVKVSDEGEVPPTPTPDPNDPTPTPTPPPAPEPNLSATIKYASKTRLGPDEVLTYTIHMFNNGTVDTTADVVDEVPVEMTVVDGSITNGGVYDAAEHTITWTAVSVPAGGEVLLEFDATANVDVFTRVMNIATITPDGEAPFQRRFWVMLVPEVPVGDDVIPPRVDSVLISDRDILTDPNVTISVEASDDQGVAWMVVREWQLNPAPVPRWEEVRTSGWMPYASEIDWTLGSSSGAHFVAVWVADAALNHSYVGAHSLDYASLVQSGEEVGANELVPYLVHYEAGEAVNATLNSTSGNADLYVWYPNSYVLPDDASLNPSGPDSISFTAPSTGNYLFVARGREAGTVFDLTITPGGGPGWTLPNAPNATGVTAVPAATTTTSTQADGLVSLLASSGITPLQNQSAPEPPGSMQQRGILRGAQKYASQLKAGPDEVFTYTIWLPNSGTADVTADVSDTLPEELTLVDGSITGGGTYDATTRTITWEDVTVPMHDAVSLTFDVSGSIDEPTIVKNTAVITPQDEAPFERTFPVLLVPFDVTDDTERPVVNSVVIDDQDVLTNPDVTIYTDATDNVGVEWMYIREWHLRSTPIPRWEEAQSSGWIPFEAEYDWTLSSESGAHFVGVWVADGGANPSQLDRRALDYASLILADETLEGRRVLPYLVHYEAGEEVTATLTPSAGDADLFVWYADSYGLPDEYSINTGTAVDEVSFVAPTSGMYLFLVRARDDTTYNLAIAPGGGPAPQSASSIQSVDAAQDLPDLPTFSLLIESGLDPLEVAEAPAPPEPNPDKTFGILLPVVVRQ